MIYAVCQATPALTDLLKELGMLEEAIEDQTNPSQGSPVENDNQVPSDPLTDVTLMIKSSDAGKLKTIADHYKLNHFTGQPSSA